MTTRRGRDDLLFAVVGLDDFPARGQAQPPLHASLIVENYAGAITTRKPPARLVNRERHLFLPPRECRQGQAEGGPFAWLALHADDAVMFL